MNRKSEARKFFRPIFEMHVLRLGFCAKVKNAMKSPMKLLNIFMLWALINLTAVILYAVPPQDKAKRIDSMARKNLAMLAVALQQYSEDYDDTLPPAKTMNQLQRELWPYLKSNKPFANPETGTPFAYNWSLSGRSMATVYAASFKKKQAFVCFYDRMTKTTGSRLALFLPKPDIYQNSVPQFRSSDGNGDPFGGGPLGSKWEVKSVSAKAWDKMKKLSGIH